MNAITREESLALSLPERAATALASAEHEVKLRELVQQSVAIVAVTNKAGREECHSAYMKLKTTRVNIGHKVNEVTEDAKLFTKAVKTEAERLVGIMAAEEDRLQALRDAWDEAEQARKDALIAAERARVEAIADRITALREDEIDAVRIDKTAEQTRTTLEYSLARAVTPELFEERFDEAVAVHAEVVASIRAILAKREADEAAAAEAEAARQAEIARIAAEREELAKLRAEQAERERLAKVEADRVAAEQAAEAKRLTDLAAEQAAELQKMRDTEAARALAEQQERDRVAAESKRQMDAQQAAIAAERKALDEERAAATKAAQERADAAALYQAMADHFDDAAAEDAQRTEARRAELQAAADDALAAGRERAADEHAAGLPAGALGADALADVDAEEVSDSEIFALIADVFDMSILDAVDRVSRIDFGAARTLAEAA